MSKYIFLDFDGVLNDPYWLLKSYYTRRKRSKVMEFDLRRLEYLAQIVDYTDAKLVLSSTWNNRDGVKEFFEFLGFEVAGQLGNFGNRGVAIEEWIDKNCIEDCDYIIMDDEDSDYEEKQLEHLVYTGTNHVMSWVMYNHRLAGRQIGLDERHVPWAINLLNGDIDSYENDKFRERNKK